MHYVVPAGGFNADRSAWISANPRFFLPVEALSTVFRGKFIDSLRALFRRRQLQFHGTLEGLRHPRVFACYLQSLYAHQWVVYAKKPFGGPTHVLQYLGRYTHRVAISNHRLLRLENGRVTFRWKDYAHGNKKRKMTLEVDEFIRRFLLHVLPRGFVRIRHFGWMANRHRTRLALACRSLLHAATPQPRPSSPAPPNASYAHACPFCGGPVTTLERLTAAQLRRRSGSTTALVNST